MQHLQPQRWATICTSNANDESFHVLYRHYSILIVLHRTPYKQFAYYSKPLLPHASKLFCSAGSSCTRSMSENCKGQSHCPRAAGFCFSLGFASVTYYGLGDGWLVIWLVMHSIAGTFQILNPTVEIYYCTVCTQYFFWVWSLYVFTFHHPLLSTDHWCTCTQLPAIRSHVLRPAYGQN